MSSKLQTALSAVSQTCHHSNEAIMLIEKKKK